MLIAQNVSETETVSVFRCKGERQNLPYSVCYKLRGYYSPTMAKRRGLSVTFAKTQHHENHLKLRATQTFHKTDTAELCFTRRHTLTAVKRHRIAVCILSPLSDSCNHVCSEIRAEFGHVHTCFELTRGQTARWGDSPIASLKLNQFIITRFI
jgi:hypothetical protein